jgi:hypothetical protein
MRIAAAFLLGSSAAALGFSTSGRRSLAPTRSAALHLAAETDVFFAASKEEQEVSKTKININDTLQIPLSYNEMILQSSQAMTDALAAGKTRQIVRILLPRDASSDNIGVYYEAEAQTSSKLNAAETTKLVPTDESWQGGIMQLYRAAAPTTKDIMRQLSPTMRETGVPPKIVEDRSIDESGVDGLGLLYTQIGSSSGTLVEEKKEDKGFGFFGESFTLPKLSQSDMCVFVQPSQEIIDSIETLSTQNAASSPPLIALLNPQWRNVDDALDSASKNDNVFGAFASFLGGKGNSLRRLDSLGYQNTYTLEGYVCKGGNIRLLKRFDSDWIVFAENDTGDKWVRVGQAVARPTYQDVEKMLNDKGVGYKYARDLGLAPKL